MTKHNRNFWHAKLQDMIKECNKQGIRVVFVPDSKTLDFIGMNPLAAKDMHFPMNAQHTFWVDKNLSIQEKYETLRHEYVEYFAMKKNGGKYIPAHVLALDDEGHLTEQGC